MLDGGDGADFGGTLPFSLFAPPFLVSTGTSLARTATVNSTVGAEPPTLVEVIPSQLGAILDTELWLHLGNITNTPPSDDDASDDDDRSSSITLSIQLEVSADIVLPPQGMFRPSAPSSPPLLLSPASRQSPPSTPPSPGLRFPRLLPPPPLPSSPPRPATAIYISVCDGYELIWFVSCSEWPALT